MKTLAFALLFSLFISAPAIAATCKVVTKDVGTIHGKGKSTEKAFEDAATQCFDRREKLYKMTKGGPVDEDSGLVMIDMCANVTCS